MSLVFAGQGHWPGRDKQRSRSLGINGLEMTGPSKLKVILNIHQYMHFLIMISCIFN